MEITFPLGTLTPEFFDDVKSFYGDVYGFTCTSGPMFGQPSITMRSAERHNDFILLIEGDEAMAAPGFDHLGFELTSRDEVDATLTKVKQWRERDDADRAQGVSRRRHGRPALPRVLREAPAPNLVRRAVQRTSGGEVARQICVRRACRSASDSPANHHVGVAS